MYIKQKPLLYIYSSNKLENSLELFLKDYFKIYFGQNYKLIIKEMQKLSIYNLYIISNDILVKNLNFYNECKINNINIINDKIFFKKDIDRIISSTIKIPVLKKSKYYIDYNNLVIESIDMKFPLLLKNGNKILQKIDNVNDLVIYKDYFNFSNELYLQIINNEFIKIKVYFVNINGHFQILECYNVLYSILGKDIILISSDFFLNDIVKNDVKNIAEYFKLSFGCIDFIIMRKNIFFYSLHTIDKLLKYQYLFKDIFNIDLYEIKFNNNNNNAINIKVKKNLIIMTELIFNSNDFLQFYKNNITKKIHFKERTELNNDILILLKLTTNILFKEFCYNDIKYIFNDKTYIRNLYNKDEINIINILNPSELSNIKIGKCNDNFILDDYNSKISNYIIGNKNNENIIQIQNDIELFFTNNAFICITGSTKNIELRVGNNIKNTYNIIQVLKGDILSIKNIDNNNNLNYLSILNGFCEIDIKKFMKIFYNKSNIDNINNINNIDNLKIIIPNINSNFNLKIIESSFSDKFNENILDFIYKNNFNVYKIESDKIILRNKHLSELYDSILIKDKKYRYCKGSVILNKMGLIIVTSNNYDYYDGLSIFTIISSELWRLNYIINLSIINFTKVSLSYSLYLKKVIDNIINYKKGFLEKKMILDGINETKLVMLSLFDKNNLINIEIRLMGDNHILIDYTKNKDSLLKDNLFIEYSFRQKIVEKYILNNKINYINITSFVFGLNSYIIKCNNINRDKLVLDIYDIEKKILIENNIETREIKLPILLDKTYFSDNKYLKSILKINNIKNKLSIKNFINNMKFIVLDINSINPNTFSLIPYDPRTRLTLIDRDINQKVKNGTISIGKFFSNIHYNNESYSKQTNTIIGKTIPIFIEQNKSFILKRFDIINFELINKDVFYSIINHFNLGTYYIDIKNILFNIYEYRNFFINNIDDFINYKNNIIINFNKEKDNVLINDTKKLINVYNIKSNSNCEILDIYITLNNFIKIGDVICKIISYDNKNIIKSLIKSNVNGLIIKINIKKYDIIKKDFIIINILKI